MAHFMPGANIVHADDLNQSDSDSGSGSGTQWDTPESQYDLIQEGPFATVSRTCTEIKDDGEPQWVVVKSSTTQRRFAREPHDIVKELRLLSGMAHLNIVSVLGSFRDDEQHMLSIYMPYLPISLSNILASPHFSPHLLPSHVPSSYSSYSSSTPNPSSSSTSTSTAAAAQVHEAQFTLLAKSLMLQTLSALAFLHDLRRRIGHRDIKPENIMLTRDGCVKLIDFGVSWKEVDSDEEEQEEGGGGGRKERTRDLWPETRGRMYFEVSTRAYRAPELLFSTRNYDQCAIDLWSLGAIFAEFFTPLRLAAASSDDGDDDEDEVDDSSSSSSSSSSLAADSKTNPNPNPNSNSNSKHDGKADKQLDPFIVPRYLSIGYPGARWRRDTLFNGDRGEIGLAWSIFKVFGTPDKENWPGFKDLPGATSVVFNVVPRVPLLPLLPNLPPSSITFAPPSSSTSTSTSTSTSSSSTTAVPKPKPKPKPAPTQTPTSPITDLLSRLLTYPPAERISAEEAMRHPWFTGSCLGLGLGLESSTSSISSSGSSTAARVMPGSVPDLSGSGENAVAPAPAREEDPTKEQQTKEKENPIKEKDTTPAAILLPPGYALDRNQGWLRGVLVYEWEGRTLGDVLGDVLGE